MRPRPSRTSRTFLLGRDIEDDAGTVFSGSTVTTWLAIKKSTYTPTSKVKTVTDADARVTSSDYDGDDRLLTVTDPVSRKVHYVTDAAGQTLTELGGEQQRQSSMRSKR